MTRKSRRITVVVILVIAGLLLVVISLFFLDHIEDAGVLMASGFLLLLAASIIGYNMLTE